MFCLMVCPALSQFDLIESAKPESLSRMEIDEIMGADSAQDVLASGYLSSEHVTCLFDAMGYYYTGGEYKNTLIRFRLRKPQSYIEGEKSDKKYPLVIWFHGVGESGEDNKRQLAHLQHIMPLLSGEKQREFFLLATQCPLNHGFWTTDSDTPSDIADTPLAYTEEIVDSILETYPIDRARISLVGICAGMFAVRQFIADKPNVVAAAVAISYAMPDKFNDKPVTDVALWFFYTDRDYTTDSDTIKAYAKRVRDLGGTAKITECKYETGDAHNSWRAAFVKYKAFEWLLEQRRKNK
jgi:predicted peptidase